MNRTTQDVRDAVLAIAAESIPFTERPFPYRVGQNGADSDILVVEFASRADMARWLDYFGAKFHTTVRADLGVIYDNAYSNSNWRGWTLSLSACDPIEPEVSE